MPNSSISLLPEHVANQIAAGEVVQRPASVVKELLENAIDAGATQIKLIIKDAGKTLIQVIDNGKGMSPFDARMCFERHATSKITKADDLFTLTTKGFRGEALASIAAIAQVELKTKREEDIVAQQVMIEGGKFIIQQECQFAVGSSFTVKNLFFNIPARRNFLKNDQVELKHIIDEIERLAIPYPHIHFIFISNDNEVMNLPANNLMTRIKSLLGNYIQKELVPIDENTPFVKIEGYVSLPEAAIKSKKEQYFFVNNRFVRNPFLNHAVYTAYKDLINNQSHPRYFIFLELNPKHIDINIHPTKTEIKFTDEKTVYMLLVSSIKRALGKANVAPSLDFEQEMSFQTEPAKLNQIYQAPEISYNQNYNPFQTTSKQTNYNPIEKINKQNWEKLYDGFKQNSEEQRKNENTEQQAIQPIQKESIDFEVFQLNSKYIVTTCNQSVFIIDQQRAHERVLYEHFLNTNVSKVASSQQLLFPEHIELSANDFELLKELLSEFKILGFDLEIFGKNNIAVNGQPSDLEDINIQETIEGILETYKINTIDVKIEKHDNLCRAFAKNAGIKYGKVLDKNEMKLLVSGLLACENPNYTASGKSVLMDLPYQDLEKYFRKQ
jgi:DNA mismatch repair protein MutL